MSKTTSIFLATLLTIIAIPLMIILPEFGIPILLLATRLLSPYYKWAAKLNLKIEIYFKRFKRFMGRTLRRVKKRGR